MTTVFKYDILPKVADNTCFAFVDLPVDAQILHVGEQDGIIRLWAQVGLMDRTETRRAVRKKFLMVPTGGIIPQTLSVKFVGTVQMLSGLVWHLFEQH